MSGMSEILDGIVSTTKIVIEIINWICTIVFVIGLLAVIASPQEATAYVVEQYFIPSLFGAIFTDLLMELFEPIIPSSLRTVFKVMVELAKTLMGM
jgi:hypothetical protein